MREKSIENAKKTRGFDDLFDERRRIVVAAAADVVVFVVVFRFSTCKTSGKKCLIDKNRQNLWRENWGKTSLQHDICVTDNDSVVANDMDEDEKEK